MVIDTSAIAAILFDEPERGDFTSRIGAAAICRLSAASYLEISMVALSRQGGLTLLDTWIRENAIDIVPVDAAQVLAGRDAFARFGKGRHPAGLNYGDCFSYALAAVTGEPLLFKGDDFSRTDIAPAPP
jgi:ribonuclease VapC